jgi:hypothetical protein
LWVSAHDWGIQGRPQARLEKGQRLGARRRDAHGVRRTHGTRGQRPLARRSRAGVVGSIGACAPWARRGLVQSPAASWGWCWACRSAVRPQRHSEKGKAVACGASTSRVPSHGGRCASASRWRTRERAVQVRGGRVRARLGVEEGAAVVACKVSSLRRASKNGGGELRCMWVLVVPSCA